MQFILVAVFLGMCISSVALIVSMSFIMSVAVLFVIFLHTLEHRDDMRHGGVAERGEIEMHDHEGAEEDPEDNMDQNRNLDSSKMIHAGPKRLGSQRKDLLSAGGGSGRP